MQIGIKKTLLLYSVATALLPILLIGLVSRPIIRNQLIKGVDESNLTLAHSMSNQITTYLKEPGSSFKFIAKHTANQNHSNSDLSDLLDNLANSYSYFESLYLLDKVGEVRSVGSRTDSLQNEADYLGMDFSSIEICKRAQNEKSFQWQSTLSVTSGEPSVSFCGPMGEGTLLATLKLSDISQVISKASTSGIYEVFIVDRKGRIISHPDPTVVIHQLNVSNLQIVRDALTGGASSGTFEFRNSSYRGAAKSIEGFDWVLVAAQNLDVAMAPVKAFEKILLMGVLSALLLMAVIGTVISALLSRPFNQLSVNAHHVINEDYISIKPISSRLTEITLLSETLDKMVDAVKIREELLNEQTEELMASEENLRDLNESLEQKVLERTDQLAVAMEELNALNLDLTQRSIALENANQQLKSFAYSVSHDLRAPLHHVSGFTSIIAEEYSDALDEKGQDYLRRVVKGCAKMEELINAILEFSQVSRQAINITRVDMSALVSEVLSDFQKEIDELRVETVVGDLPMCSADRILIKQVMANLVGNALKYSRKKDTPRVEIGSTINDGEIVFFIKDNGVGFDMLYADKLFGVFSRLHSQDDFEGTGVGLAIVANIIQRHDGRIWAEATPEQGATFFFTLPEQADSLIVLKDAHIS